jgi:hypothetical protein
VNSKDFYKALTKFKRGKPEPLYETTAVLCYEVGKMLEQAMYMYWHSSDDQEVKARRGFFKSELMDVLAQCDLICGSLGVSFEEMRALGQEKALERFTGKEKK